MMELKHSLFCVAVVGAITACHAPAESPTSPSGGTPSSVAASGERTSGGQGAQSHGGPIQDHVSLVDALRAQGVTVAIRGDVEQPFLRAKGVRLGLSGGPLPKAVEVQAYTYDDADTARADAGAIGDDGNPRTMMITWVDDPHFFLKERVIVLYVGKDPQALTLLRSQLGPQFAGR
jgi:hypothetical protein